MSDQFTLRDLFDKTGAAPKEKARGTDIFGFPNRSNQRRFPYYCISGEEYSDPKGHLASITFPNVQIPFEKLWQYPKINPGNRRVRVFCSCEAFQYWGAAYHSTQEGYRIPGTGSEGRSPDIRDPNGTGYLCKHLIRVARRVVHQTFPQLLKDFEIISSVKKSYASLIEPTLYEFLERTGVDQNKIVNTCGSLNEHNWEQVLDTSGMLVKTDSLGG